MKKKSANKKPSRKPKHKKMLVMFWLKSSRGTDTRWPFECPVGTSRAKIKEALGEWVERIIRDRPAIDSCTYGVRSLRRYTRQQLLRMWNRHCKIYDRVKERRDELSAMLLKPQDMSRLME